MINLHSHWSRLIYHFLHYYITTTSTYSNYKQIQRDKNDLFFIGEVLFFCSPIFHIFHCYVKHTYTHTKPAVKKTYDIFLHNLLSSWNYWHADICNHRTFYILRCHYRTYKANFFSRNHLQVQLEVNTTLHHLLKYQNSCQKHFEKHQTMPRTLSTHNRPKSASKKGIQYPWSLVQGVVR